MTSIVNIAPPQYRFMRASEWGMTWKRPAVPEKLLDPEAFVHHSAGSRLGTDAVRAFQALNKWAQDAKDFSALDYDILVHRSTSTGIVTIGGGREEWMSAATKDRNEQGEAICVMGYFHPGHRLSEQPHPDEIEGVALAIVWSIEHGWNAPNPTILGHHQNPAWPNATGCPGSYFVPHLPHVRSRVAYWLDQLKNPNIPEDDEMPGPEYIRTPPPGSPSGWPFFYVRGASIRYADGGDVAYARANSIPIGPDPDPAKAMERYVLMHRSVIHAHPGQ